MRVFVSLDDELYRALQNRALKRGVSFQAVMNETVARGLAAGVSDSDPPKRAQEKRARKGRPGKRTRFDQLLDDL